MGKTRDLFKKIRDTNRTFHEKISTIKKRNVMDQTDAEDIKKKWQNTQKNYTKKKKKNLHDSDNHDAVIPYHLEPDILE